jgi:hypothetical protein
MTTVDEQNVCIDCLIKPRKSSLMVSQQSTPEVPMDDKESVSNAPKGEKLCDDCHKPFKPNSGRQKYCNDCKKLREEAKPRKRRNIDIEVPASKKSSGQTFINIGLALLTDVGVNKMKIEDE